MQSFFDAFTKKKVKIGDIVIIRDAYDIYYNAKWWAKEFNLTKYKSTGSEGIKNGRVGKVINVGCKSKRHVTIVALDLGDCEILISKYGICKAKNNPNNKIILR